MKKAVVLGLLLSVVQLHANDTKSNQTSSFSRLVEFLAPSTPNEKMGVVVTGFAIAFNYLPELIAYAFQSQNNTTE